MSKGTSWMQNSLNGEIGRMCKLRGLKRPDKGFFLIHGNARIPCASATLANPKKPALIMASRLLNILHVHAIGYVAQIYDAIVRWVPVDVVNVARRPRTVRVQPCETMGLVYRSCDPNEFSASVLAIAYSSASSRSSAFVNACKNTSYRVVVKKLAQTLRGKIIFIHDTVLSLIGQRPVRVSSTYGPCYFNT